MDRYELFEAIEVDCGGCLFFHRGDYGNFIIHHDSSMSL